MKKLFALVLALLMLLSAVVVAEELGAPKGVQDEMPPVVVGEVNAEGKIVLARICDADGNVLAEVLEDGSLELTDVHFRGDVENQEISNRLTSAYEDVMEDVHHSDVECKLHDHDVKVDIDDILASLGQDLDAYDLVMYELYDTMLHGAAAELLAVEGNYLELTFQVGEGQSMPLIIMYSDNGNEWQVIQYVDSPADGQFTVRLPGSGSMALLTNGREVLNIGKSEYVPGTYIPGTPDEYEEVTDNFTPSVSGKGAPQLVKKQGTEGQWIAGTIRNSVTQEFVEVPDANYIIITPFAGRDYNVDIQTHEHLEWAFDSILEVEDVGELYTEHDMSQPLEDHEHGTIAGLLDETLAQMGLDLTHDQLVVKDLFEVSVYGDYVHYLQDPNNYLDVTFDTDLDPENPAVVLHSYDSKHWHVHPIEEFVINAEGQMTLQMYDIGVVAFLVEAEESVNPDTAVQSPV